MCVSKHTNTWARFSYNNMRVISLSVPKREGQQTLVNNSDIRAQGIIENLIHLRILKILEEM